MPPENAFKWWIEQWFVMSLKIVSTILGISSLIASIFERWGGNTECYCKNNGLLFLTVTWHNICQSQPRKCNKFNGLTGFVGSTIQVLFSHQAMQGKKPPREKNKLQSELYKEDITYYCAIIYLKFRKF